LTKLTNSFQRAIKAFDHIFINFPLAILASWGFLFIVISDIHKINLGFETTPVLYSLALAILLFTLMRVITKKRLFCIVGILIVIAYYFEIRYSNSFKEFNRFSITAISLFILMIWFKNNSNRLSNIQFLDGAKKIVSNLITSVGFSIVVTFGAMAALKSLQLLFDLKVDNKIYGDIFFISIIFIGLNYFLYHLLTNSNAKTNQFLNRVNLIFTKYILTPITMIYLLILYSYTFKILIEGVLPKGILAWIIIGFTLVSLITYLSWTPYWDEKSRRYKKFFILAILLQTIMLGISIYIRISEYGWTISRYLVASYGVWLFGVSLYLLIKDDAKYKWIFLSLSFILLFSQYGLFSAYEISYKDQLSRLTKLLEKNKNISQYTPIKIRYEISDKIDYLTKNFGIDSLKTALPNIVDAYLKDRHISNPNSIYNRVFYDFPIYATKKLGFDYVSYYQYLQESKKGDINDGFKTIYLFDKSGESFITIKGYDYLAHFMGEEVLHIPDLNSSISLSKDMRLIIKENNKLFKKIELNNFFKNLSKNALSNSSSIGLSQDSMSFKYNDKDLSIMIIFNNILMKNKKPINFMGDIYYKRF